MREFAAGVCLCGDWGGGSGAAGDSLGVKRGDPGGIVAGGAEGLEGGWGLFVLIFIFILIL